MRSWNHGEGKLWADAMSHAFAERFGRWAVGWRWAHDEGDIGGGPVGSWCCPRHSITTPEETLAHVAAALCEWRAWLESLAGRFEAYPLESAAVADQRILWERAARNLIWQVVDRTGHGSGWHGHCEQVLTWFLQRWHVAADVAQALVAEAIGGRFHSWTSPETVLVDDVAERLALSLSRDDTPEPAKPDSRGPLTDHLERWLAARGSVPWHNASDGGRADPVTPSRDGAVEDVRAFDGAIEPARAKGLVAALELVRMDAAHGRSLTFERLQSWQQHVLNTPQPPPFRRSPAFAKGGRERYGIGPDTHPPRRLPRGERVRQGPSAGLRATRRLRARDIIRPEPVGSGPGHKSRSKMRCTRSQCSVCGLRRSGNTIRKVWASA
ncbi:hypothetical protein SAMN05443665_10762 [Actinomadura meyerae]|uniref:Uncharacterized protein n=1 Tax=Actinomadura meyerae TaxID=240840 RepID=A0A239P6G1_9ACTN|nr:hypothetical protein SAMN05443665_10762 [Actinomadura meyerae]